MWKKIAVLVGATLLAVPANATDMKVVCPSACTVTLPATTWDAIGGAISDSITVRQQLFGEIARQVREQMPAPPKPDEDPARSPGNEDQKPKDSAK